MNCFAMHQSLYDRTNSTLLHLVTTHYFNLFTQFKMFLIFLFKNILHNFTHQMHQWYR